MQAVIDKLAAHGTILFVVDQPARIGALPVAVAQAAGVTVSSLPGLAMRQIADLQPGQRCVATGLKELAPQMYQRLIDGVFTALEAQTVVVVGTNAAAIGLPQLAQIVTDLRASRDMLCAQVEALVEAHPQYRTPVLDSGGVY